jgi:hypothetical protein
MCPYFFRIAVSSNGSKPAFLTHISYYQRYRFSSVQPAAR